MPPTRRTRNSGGTAKGAQKTLSFASSKAPLPSSSKGKGKPSDAPASSILATPTTTITPAQAQDPSPTAALDPSSAAQDNPSLGHATSHLAVAQQGTSTITQLKNEQSPEEVRARKVTDAQIRRYWREREGERRAGRVHQGGLEVEERVLRLWDVSGQFGPAIGIARTKRWLRAHKLGLAPPIEVLAILLREQEKNDGKGEGKGNSERAYVDELMSAKVGGEEA